MKYYCLEIKEGEDQASILWETESNTLWETHQLTKTREGYQYEIVSEDDIKAEIQKYYDVESAENFLH